MSYAKTGLLISMKNWFSAPTSAEQLMRQFVESGDESAFSQLYDDHSNRLYYYLLVMSDPDVAADITQKTWLKILERKYSYINSGKFESWLFTLGRNALFDEFKKHKAHSQENVTVERLVDETTITLTSNRTSFSADDFHNALKSIPFEQREAFSLQQEGFSLQEIAKICHQTPETIKTRLRYAREKLKKYLEKHNG